MRNDVHPLVDIMSNILFVDDSLSQLCNNLQLIRRRDKYLTHCLSPAKETTLHSQVEQQIDTINSCLPIVISILSS